MIDTLHPQDPATWARLHFAGASLGDVRRTQRVRTIASALAQNPAQSIPQLFAHPYAVSRPPIPSSTARRLPPNVYRQRAPGVGPGAIEGEQPGVYLLVEDGSEISFSGKKPIEGLGFIANGQEGLEGFLLHSVLAMRWWWGDDAQNGDGKRPPVEVLGLAAQSYRVRHEKRGRGKETSTHSKKRGRESEEWLTSGATLGAAPSNP